MNDRQRLRQTIRARRRELPPARRTVAAAAVARQLRRHRLYREAHDIALFIANDGELSPHLVARLAARARKRCYLPVLRPGNRLAFVRYLPDITVLRPNRFGIDEPRFRPRDIVPPTALDLVLMPLVAFDGQGNRLGMGGGFYDRTFAFMRRRHHRRWPVLIGIAWELQHVRRLDSEPWDIPLGAVVTEKRLRLFRKAGRN